MRSNKIDYFKHLILILALIVAIPAIGSNGADDVDDDIDDDSREKNRQELREDIEDDREEFRKEAEQERERVKEQIEQNKEAFREQFEEMKENSSSTKEWRENLLEFIGANKALRASSTEDIREKREVLREEIKNRILQYKESVKVELTEERRERVEAHLENAFVKMGNAIVRLEEFDKKIETKIDFIKDNGGDTTEAEDKLAAARSALEEARLAISSAKDGASDAIASSTNSGIGSGALKEAIKDALESIREARDSYIEVIKAMAAARPDDDSDDDSDDTDDDNNASSTTN